MNLIVAVDRNWGIGNKGELLVRIPEDLRRFKKLTTGKVVVLGRKTLETFPDKKPLPNRTNIILTRNTEFKVDGAIVVHSIEELLEELKNYNSDDIFIIGGQSIYEQMLPYCDAAYITTIQNVYDADAYFPNLCDLAWKTSACSEDHEYNGIKYYFTLFSR